MKKIGEVYLSSECFKSEDEGAKTVGQPALTDEVINNRRTIRGLVNEKGAAILDEVREYFRDEFDVEVVLRWDKHCGCSMCPCSPGYVIRLKEEHEGLLSSGFLLARNTKKRDERDDYLFKFDVEHGNGRLKMRCPERPMFPMTEEMIRVVRKGYAQSQSWKTMRGIETRVLKAAGLELNSDAKAAVRAELLYALEEAVRAGEWNGGDYYRHLEDSKEEAEKKAKVAEQERLEAVEGLVGVS